MSMFHTYKDRIIQAAQERFATYRENLEVQTYEDYQIDNTFEKGEVYVSILHHEKKSAFVDCRVFFKNGLFACDFLFGDKTNLSDGSTHSSFGNCYGKDFTNFEGILNEIQRIIDKQTALYLPGEKLIRNTKTLRCLNLKHALTEAKEAFY